MCVTEAMCVLCLLLRQHASEPGGGREREGEGGGGGERGGEGGRGRERANGEGWRRKEQTPFWRLAVLGFFFAQCIWRHRLQTRRPGGSRWPSRARIGRRMRAQACEADPRPCTMTMTTTRPWLTTFATSQPMICSSDSGSTCLLVTVTFLWNTPVRSAGGRYGACTSAIVTFAARAGRGVGKARVQWAAELSSSLLPLHLYQMARRRSVPRARALAAAAAEHAGTVPTASPRLAEPLRNILKEGSVTDPTLSAQLRQPFVPIPTAPAVAALREAAAAHGARCVQG